MSKEYNQPCTLAVQSETRIEALSQSDDKLWVAVDQIRNRLPVWATLLIGLLTGVIGYMAK